MPRGNGTGPDGMGPMTGRGMGYCAGYNAPGYMQGAPAGMGRGYGRGFGRGFRNWGAGVRRGFPSYGAAMVPPDGYDPAAAPGPDEEKVILKQQAEVLEAQLNDLRRRMKNLENDAAEE